MRFTTLALTLLASTQAALAADASSVIGVLLQIGNATAQLSSDTSKYNGGVAGLPFAIQVQQDAVYIHKLTIVGTDEANASGPFGTDTPGSIDVADALLTLSGQVSETLNVAKGKAELFGELKPIVLSTLYGLKLDTNTVAKATIEKMGEEEQAIAPIALDQLNGDFNSAIEAFGGVGKFSWKVSWSGWLISVVAVN